MHDAAYRYVKGELSTLALRPGLVVEIGSRDVNGTVRDLFPERAYIGVDNRSGQGVDVLENGAKYRAAVQPVIVVSTETLEHTPDAEAICRNVALLLVKGGVFLVTAAGEGRAPHSAIDGGPIRHGEFYHNVTEPELRSWLSDFSDVRIQVNPAACDIYATAIK